MVYGLENSIEGPNLGGESARVREGGGESEMGTGDGLVLCRVDERSREGGKEGISWSMRRLLELFWDCATRRRTCSRQLGHVAGASSSGTKTRA